MSLDANGVVSKKVPVQGFFVEQGTTYPATVQSDGRLDFGTLEEPYSTNLRSHLMTVGSVCLVWGDGDRGRHGGDQWRFRVTAIRAA